MRRIGLALLVCLLALPAGAAEAKKRRDPVLTTLAQIERRGGTHAADAQGWRDDYTVAKRAARNLRGAPQANIRGVLANLTSLAKRHLLGGRAYPAFLILQRNVEWFYDERNSAPANGTRTTFDGSELIWQFYTGSGWQLQPLANFGRLNGLLKLRKPAAGRLERFADDLLATGVQRRGFLAFEYYFPWGGGAPGWISGMATATGMQAFANLGKRDGDPRYTDAARAMLGAFKAPPPWGVTVQGNAGPSFLLYSQTPMASSATASRRRSSALDNYRVATGDPDAAALVDAAVAEARRLLPKFDTGAWSLYDRTPTRPLGGPATFYHRLFEGFLVELCDKFGDPFCGESDNFARYETEPVAISSLSLRVFKKKYVRASFVLSKRGTATATLERDGSAIRSYTAAMTRGKHTLTWKRPPKGDYDLVVKATSLTGIASEQDLAAHLASGIRRPGRCGCSGRRRLDLAPQVRDVHAQDLDIVGVLGAPDLDQQRAVGEQAAAVDGERAQQVELDRRQMHLLAVHAHHVGGEVELEAVDADHRLAGRRVGAPQRRLQARDELARAERLGHVVVGAGLQRAHLLVLLADRRQHEDRHLRPLSAGCGRPRCRRRRAARGRRSRRPAGAARRGRAPPRPSPPAPPRSRRRAG